MPDTSREVRLAVRPEGLPEPEHFAVVQVPVPVPGDGEVLVRNRLFHVFPAIRTLMAGSVKGAPFPPLNPGDTLYGKAVGEVVSAPDGGGLRAGDLVQHWQGWREYAAVPADQCAPLDDALPDPAAHLGQGAIAYAALVRDARLRPGETVFVSGGAGGVGSVAGQVARRLGAGRVVGSTGSPEKAKRLVAELGYDAAVLRGEGPFEARLAEAAPDGVDVVVDNVGGEQLQAAISLARPGARVVLVGALAGQLAADRPGNTSPVELDSFELIVKHVELRGFGGADPALDAEWNRRLGGWLRAGEIVLPEVRFAGIESAPRALHEAIGGRHLGTVIVEL
ncbi:MDR family NADP-dependent oxidoreductase [Actinomadura decatromicini]|uniref:NADP-dependent oxidoreductase n=1 Tax=Actinomadura decatromicini TaxID=2604572 RepID=A0A5D3FR18_9ACTN|nr:NADP-dependent oxidoreductase [Actinomadura decatromicini]TYK50482.1 NADP-dependent oxidoreductase [Actinomadura decatromicini]